MHPNIVGAQTLEFRCQWSDSNPSYFVEFTADTVAGIATRNDAPTKYRILQVNEYGVWLQSEAALGGEAAVITSFSRSPVGGTWSDTWIWADGETSQTAGGYCVEVLG